MPALENTVSRYDMASPYCRTLLIIPRSSKNNTPRARFMTRGSRPGISASRSLDHGYARFINYMMTMTTWSAMATCRNAFCCFQAVPTLFSSTMALSLYANTGVDGTARAQNGLCSSHDGGVATYKRIFFLWRHKKEPLHIPPDKNGLLDSVRCLNLNFFAFRQTVNPYRNGSV